jgi:hypothetical protein
MEGKMDGKQNRRMAEIGGGGLSSLRDEDGGTLIGTKRLSYAEHTEVRAKLADMAEQHPNLRLSWTQDPVQARYDALMKANYLTQSMTEEEARRILTLSIDTYHYDNTQVEAKMRKTGDELRKEAALHMAGMLAEIDTDPRTRSKEAK